MVMQELTETEENMPFGDDFDLEDEDSEVDISATSELLGGAADESLEDQLAKLLAEQAKYEETARLIKENEKRIVQLNKEKEQREREIKEFTCPKCNHYHPETKIVSSRSSSGSRGRGAGKAFPNELRAVCAMITGEMRLQGSNQSVIGKKLAETFPEVFADSDSPSVRFGTVVGTILKSGTGAWADVTGFDTSVEAYGDRSMSDIEDMTSPPGQSSFPGTFCHRGTSGQSVIFRDQTRKPTPWVRLVLRAYFNLSDY